MNPVQPVNNGQSAPTSGAAPAPIAAPASQSGGTAAVASSSSVSMVSTSTSISVSMVQSQVQNMLSSIGGGVADNDMLRMVIALMILQALLANDGGSQQANQASMLDQLGLGASRGQTMQVSMQSATNIVQINEQSQALFTSQAALTPTSTEGDQEQAGGQLDVSG